MQLPVRQSTLLIAAFVFCALTGCEMLHNLKPHRWKRLNHGIDGTPASDYSFLESSMIPESAYFASVSATADQSGPIVTTVRTSPQTACPTIKPLQFALPVVLADNPGKSQQDWLATRRRMLYL